MIMQNWEMDNYAVSRLWIIMHCIDWWLETWIFCCITKIMLNRNRQIVSFDVDEAYAELFIIVKMYKERVLWIMHKLWIFRWGFIGQIEQSYDG